MSHKKSMRIFWLSLCLLLIAGAIIIAAAQSRAHKRAQGSRDAVQKDTDPQLAAETGTDTNPAVQPTPASEGDAGPKGASGSTQLQQTSGQASAYLYELKARDGYLDVYYYHTQQLFLHTGIAYEALTQEQKQDLQKGKYFLSEEELYGYLESCTS